jgi:hypothetical protein
VAHTTIGTTEPAMTRTIRLALRSPEKTKTMKSAASVGVE